MSIDGMAARARRLAELEAAQASREQQVHDEWRALVGRAQAMGQPVPDALAGRLSSVLSAHAEALDVREQALDAFERSLTDWRAGLERVEDEDQALGRLRARLRRTLADEIGELSPAELSRVVARAFGERRRTGPLAPASEGAGPSAGVEQEALLLGQLISDEPLDTSEGPLDAVVHPPPEKAGTRTVEAAQIEDYEGADDPFAGFSESGASPEDALVTLTGDGPADIGALLGETPRAVRRPRSLMRDPQSDARDDDVELEIDVDDADLEPGEETLARWLGTTSQPVEPESAPRDAVDTAIEPLEALEAAIEPLDDADSLLEWEATGLGNEVAMLVERRRPAAARTSIMDVVEDPFDAFDDFDDSLDAPFGFVDNVTGQGPALADADWSIDEDAGAVPSAKPADIAEVTGSEFEMLQLDDPFADDSTTRAPGSLPSGSTASGSPPLQPADTGEIDGVDLGEAFPAIRAPLAADSMETERASTAIEVDGAFADALGEAFARSGPSAGDRALDSLDAFGLQEGEEDGPLDPFDSAFEAELDAAFSAPDGDALAPAPASPPAPTPTPMTVSNRPTARPWTPTDVDGAGHDASLLPAPSDPGNDGWGPRTLDDPPELVTEASSVQDGPDSADDDPDHIATDFGAALVGPAFEPGLNPFEAPQLTQPAAPPMTVSGSTNPDPSETAVPGVGPHIEAALARAEAAALRGVEPNPSGDAYADSNLTGLDWPAPRALHAFPDGSMDDGALRPARTGPRPGTARPIPSRMTHPDNLPDALSTPRPAGARSPADVTADEPHDLEAFRSASAAPPDGAPSEGARRSPTTRHGLPAGSRSPTGASAPQGAITADPRPGPPSDGSGPASPFDPAAFGAVPATSAVDPWRSGPTSASLADALNAARHDDERDDSIDAAFAAVQTADAGDEQRRVTDRFAALAGEPAADPWASLDIPQHGAGGPDALPALLRRRQGRSEATPARPLPGPGTGAPPAVVPVEESAPRAPLGVRVGLEAGDRFFTGFSRDISVDGMFVNTQHGLAVDAAVEVFFELPGGRSINARGRVRRVRRGDGGRPAGLGLRFEQLTREARVHIGRYVARTLTGKIPLP